MWFCVTKIQELTIPFLFSIQISIVKIVWSIALNNLLDHFHERKEVKTSFKKNSIESSIEVRHKSSKTTSGIGTFFKLCVLILNCTINMENCQQRKKHIWEVPKTHKKKNNCLFGKMMVQQKRAWCMDEITVSVRICQCTLRVISAETQPTKFDTTCTSTHFSNKY